LIGRRRAESWQQVCRYRYLRQVDTPGSPTLSASQLATLAKLGEERSAKPGDVLYRVGDRT
jgi:hypothetical protein